MIAAAFLCVPVFLRDRRVSRAEGLLFVLFYALYTTWIALKAQESPHLAWLQAVVLFVVLPTLAVGVLVWSLRAARRLRRNRSLET